MNSNVNEIFLLITMVASKAGYNSPCPGNWNSTLFRRQMYGRGCARRCRTPSSHSCCSAAGPASGRWARTSRWPALGCCWGARWPAGPERRRWCAGWTCGGHRRSSRCVCCGQSRWRSGFCCGPIWNEHIGGGHYVSVTYSILVLKCSTALSGKLFLGKFGKYVTKLNSK